MKIKDSYKENYFVISQIDNNHYQIKIFNSTNSQNNTILIHKNKLKIINRYCIKHISKRDAKKIFNYAKLNKLNTLYEFQKN